MDDVIRIKYADLVVWASIALGAFFVVFVLIFHCYEFRCALRSLWRSVGPFVYGLIATLFTFCAYFVEAASDLLLTLSTAITHLPYAWYFFATQTILPICIYIPQSAAIGYLAAYCATGLYICTTLPKPPPPRPLVANPGASSQFFMGLRITSIL